MYKETPYYILEHCTFYLIFDHPHFEWYVINNIFITAPFRNFLYLLDKYVFDDISFILFPSKSLTGHLQVCFNTLSFYDYVMSSNHLYGFCH